MARSKKLLFVLGTRPEIIKLAPVIAEARRRKHQVKVVMTGQHKEMAAPLIQFFKLKPDFNLMAASRRQSLSELSATVLERLSLKLGSWRPDYVVVQGDTTTAFAAAYWAFCHNIAIAHVEAGLRTYNLASPYPEEGNRQLIGRIATHHFAPTRDSQKTLLNEQINSSDIAIVGNTGIDALLYTINQLRKQKLTGAKLLPAPLLNFIKERRLILVTSHRRESFGKGFENICKGLLKLADSRDDIAIVYPVHLNPNIKKPAERWLKNHPHIFLCEPLPYLSFTKLMQMADVLVTDSGGIQEEAPSLRKPIVVLRQNTERPEGVKAGFAKLVGQDPNRIVRETLKALDLGCQGRGPNPYGDGQTSRRIIQILEKN